MLLIIMNTKPFHFIPKSAEFKDVKKCSPITTICWTNRVSSVFDRNSTKAISACGNNVPVTHKKKRRTHCSRIFCFGNPLIFTALFVDIWKAFTRNISYWKLCSQTFMADKWPYTAKLLLVAIFAAYIFRYLCANAFTYFGRIDSQQFWQTKKIPFTFASTIKSETYCQIGTFYECTVCVRSSIFKLLLALMLCMAVGLMPLVNETMSKDNICSIYLFANSNLCENFPSTCLCCSLFFSPDDCFHFPDANTEIFW